MSRVGKPGQQLDNALWTMDPPYPVSYDRDPARLTAPSIAVWSASGRLRFAALPLETARQWAAQGDALVETPQAIRFSTKEDTRG
jgi:hypothetical protein